MNDNPGTTALDLLMHKLPWLKTKVENLQQENAKLKAAIKEHHDQKADDRCWMDDDKLYAAAGLEQVDRRVGDKTAMLINCARFLEKRCEGGKWPTYAELEKQLADRNCIPYNVASECVKFLDAAGMGQVVGKGNTLWCMVQEIIAERDELNERIQLAGGYHERTPREVEIEEALEETPPHLRDPADNAIAELLLLVDAGRNRVHEEVEKREAAEKERDELQTEITRVAPFLANHNYPGYTTQF